MPFVTVLWLKPWLADRRGWRGFFKLLAVPPSVPLAFFTDPHIAAVGVGGIFFRFAVQGNVAGVRFDGEIVFPLSSGEFLVPLHSIGV